MATSLQWVGRGRWQKILFYFVNWSRNELISKSIDYSLVIYTTSQLDCPKTIKSRSPGAPHRWRLMSHLFPVKSVCFWLVVAFLFVFGGRLRPCCIFVPDFFRRSIWWPKQWDKVSLHANQWRWRRKSTGGKVFKSLIWLTLCACSHFK